MKESQDEYNSMGYSNFPVRIIRISWNDEIPPGSKKAKPGSIFEKIDFLILKGINH
jgi:hypothetical protein